MSPLRPHKIKLFIAIIITMILHCHSTFSQEEANLRLQQKPVGTLYQKSTMYPGSEFLFDDWKSGVLLFKSGRQLENILLNYNAFTDDIVYLVKGNTSIVVSKFQLSGFIVHGEEGARSFILSTSDSLLSDLYAQACFLEVLYNGNNKLYGRYSRHINNLLAKDNPFNKSVYYQEAEYLACVKSTLLLAPHKKLSYFNHYDKSEVKELIRSNSLSLHNVSDLVVLIAELDKLDNEANEKHE